MTAAIAFLEVLSRLLSSAGLYVSRATLMVDHLVSPFSEVEESLNLDRSFLLPFCLFYNRR